MLPFANLSGDPSQDYFADGVTENLTTELSRIRNSFVIARNTAFTFKGKTVDAKEIGRELGVRYILEGSVQRDQNRVRVNAQLIDAQTGSHLWADRFEEDVADLFKLQDQVVARLANTLGYELIKADAKRVSRSKSPDAVDLTMRGRAILLENYPPTKDKNMEARNSFEQALKVDPTNADALASDAHTYMLEYLFGWGDQTVDYDKEILGRVDQAILLDKENGWAQYVKSIYLLNSHRPNEALEAADAGLIVNPNLAILYSARAIAEISLGRFDQGKIDARQAIRLSPRDPLIGLWHVQIAGAELGLRHFQAVIDEDHAGIDGGYRSYQAYSGMAAAYALSDRMDEAQTALAEARRLNPKLTVKWLVGHSLNIPPWFEGLRKAGLPEE